VKAPGCNPWNPKRDLLVSEFAFSGLNLCRYNEALDMVQIFVLDRKDPRRVLRECRVVGLYKLNAVDPYLESAWFHQPLCV
jgi:hypothetical protein